jgi:Bifunctional DNA primase/polymerase, N-terminal/Primase C terminal 1 (PriCT-1)
MHDKKEMYMPYNVQQSALDYLERGWSVVPVRAREKHPVVAWQGYQQRRATSGDVRSWFARWPDANVGIVTGVVSGLVVMDVDPQHGGIASLAELEREHGPLLQTVEAVSGGGGRHLYFAHPGGHVNNRVALAAGIDMRGDGGLIVAPPSIHPSGRRYLWRPGHSPLEIALASLPGWLLDKITLGGGPRGHSPAYWRRLISEGVSEGSRNNTIASLAGHLLWHGVDPDVISELLLCWNRERSRPPLSDEEVLRTIDSIHRLHQRHGEDEPE